MKLIKQKILPIIITILMGIGLVAPSLNTAPAYADDAKEHVAILTDCWNEEDNNGGGIACIVRLVANILTVVIGVAGVIGIVVVGIQYLTAGGNEEQTRKAKRRLFEIVIGIAVYALAYTLLNWLLPDYDNSVKKEGVIFFTTLIGA